MNRFAELLDRLTYEQGRNNKLRLMTDYFRNVPDPERGWALAALTGRVWLDAVRPSWFVFSGGFQRSSWAYVIKRAIDLASSVIGLILTAPVMAAVALAIRLDSKGPVLYRQTRVGPPHGAR